MDETTTRAREAPSWQPLAFFVFALIVMAARRPDILTEAQLWAEDGAVWYADAYNNGALRALFIPHSGYLQTISRLVFGVAQWLPLAWVPLFANATGLVIRALPVAFLFSRRFAWVDVRARVAIALYYLLMPDLAEVHANITNTHWYLAIYLLMVVLAPRPTTPYQRAHDFIVLVVAGLSGPFIIFLTPAILMRALWEKSGQRPLWRRAIDPFTLLAVALAAIQAALVLWTASATRGTAPLGASLPLLLQLIAQRIIVGTIVPPHLSALGGSLGLNLLLVTFVVAIAAFAIQKGGWKVAALISLPVLLTAAALISPVVSESEPQWPLLLTGGNRYFVVPHLIVVALVVAAIGLSPWRPSRRASWLLIAAAAAVVVPGFRIEPVANQNFTAAVATYDAATPGRPVNVPIAPAGWSMTLIKH